MTPSPFRWIDGERTIVFGAGALAEAGPLLGDGGYTLLTTARASAAAPGIAERAGHLHDVPDGRVDELAAELHAAVGEPALLVALGGGRVIDTAKALAAAAPEGRVRVAAIPTTLSGAEMTAIHRQMAGVTPERARGVRPAIVVNDPELSASQPPAGLAASAGNALGHAFEGPLTPLRHPVATHTAWSAARQIRAAFAGPEPDRYALALGAMLAGYVIGSTHYGLHHILSQTLVRFAGAGHGPANSIMLPHSLIALERRFPDELARFEAELGEAPESLARRIGALAGPTRLRDVIADHGVLEQCAEQAASRPDLALTPPAADREEIAALYDAAW